MIVIDMLSLYIYHTKECLNMNFVNLAGFWSTVTLTVDWECDLFWFWHAAFMTNKLEGLLLYIFFGVLLTLMTV